MFFTSKAAKMLLLTLAATIVGLSAPGAFGQPQIDKGRVVQITITTWGFAGSDGSQFFAPRLALELNLWRLFPNDAVGTLLRSYLQTLSPFDRLEWRGEILLNNIFTRPGVMIQVREREDMGPMLSYQIPSLRFLLEPYYLMFTERLGMTFKFPLGPAQMIVSGEINIPQRKVDYYSVVATAPLSEFSSLFLTAYRSSLDDENFLGGGAQFSTSFLDLRTTMTFGLDSKKFKAEGLAQLSVGF